MKHFPHYPISMVFSEAWQDHADRRFEKSFSNDPDMVVWWGTVGTSRLEIMEDAPSPVARRWETEVDRLLRQITSSTIGKLVFPKLKLDSMYWILPLRDSHKEECVCNAETVGGEHSKRQGGGHRIFFSPDKVVRDDPDDVLLHEFVHAYRGTYGRRVDAMIDDETPNGEEFLAHQVQQIYRSSIGRKVEYVYDRNPRSPLPVHGSPQDVYLFLVQRPVMIQALEYFLNTEPLCRELAKVPRVPYNPFRDFATVKRIANDKAISNRDLGVPLSKLLKWP